MRLQGRWGTAASPPEREGCASVNGARHANGRAGRVPDDDGWGCLASAPADSKNLEGHELSVLWPC